MADDGGDPGGDSGPAVTGDAETGERAPPVPPVHQVPPTGWLPGPPSGPSGSVGWPYPGYGPPGYAPSGYGAPGYPPAAGQWAYAPGGYGDFGQSALPRRRTNGLAVAALVLACSSFLFVVTAPLAVVFGHIALFQTKRRREDGWGLALAGTILGWCVTAGWTAILVFGFTHRGPGH